MRSLFSVLALTLTMGIAGCGSDDAPAAGGASAGDSKAQQGPVIVAAAASLQTAFTRYGEAAGSGMVRFSFAGSDALAAQIEQGVRPDVFAAANTKLPEALFAKGLVERPVVFAGNRLVLAVPANDATVGALDDLEAADVKLAIGSAGVPVGAYTRKVLGRLPAAERTRILANVKTEEPDVKGIVGKLTQGAVDAGFVYITDVAASGGALKAIELPAALKPSAAYGVAVVKGAKHPEAAQSFIDGLLDGPGQRALEGAGFEPPPSPTS